MQVDENPVKPTDRGIQAHRVVITIERTIRRLTALGVPQHTAERMAIAYTLGMEKEAFFARRKALRDE
jgi:hypothetical protein